MFSIIHKFYSKIIITNYVHSNQLQIIIITTVKQFIVTSITKSLIDSLSDSSQALDDPEPELEIEISDLNLFFLIPGLL